MYSYLLIVLASLLLLPAAAQDYLLALRQSEEQAFQIITTEGEVRFTLPPGHEPSVLSKREPIRLGNFYTLAPEAPAIAVTDGHYGYYLVNPQGTQIAQLPDSLNWVSPWQNGYFRVYEPNQGARNSSWIKYYDATGQPLFGEQRYREASPFRQGRALVQLEDRDGPWYLMDSLGNYQLALSDSLSGLIRSYKWKEKGVWELSIKATDSWSYRKHYLHPDGRMSNRESELWPPGIQPRLGDLPETGLAVHPHISRRIQELPMFVFPEYYQTDTYGLYLFPDTVQGAPEDAQVLYDHRYRTITVPTVDSSEQLRPNRFFGRFLLMERVKPDSKRCFLFVDTRDFSFGLEVDDLPPGTRVDGNLLFYETRAPFNRITVHKIVRLDGQVIYEPAASKTLFRSLDAALTYPDQTIELQLDGITVVDLMKLPELPNLEVLKLKNVFGKQLPRDVFGQLAKLRVLHLQYAKDLEALPADLPQATRLTSIRLSDCPKLADPMAILQQLPALQRLHTDYPFSRAQREQLQTAHPDLIVEEMLMAVPAGN